MKNDRLLPPPPAGLLAGAQLVGMSASERHTAKLEAGIVQLQTALLESREANMHLRQVDAERGAQLGELVSVIAGMLLERGSSFTLTPEVRETLSAWKVNATGTEDGARTVALVSVESA